MHWFIRLTTAIFLTVISFILLLSVSLSYLIVTPLGGKILLRYFKQEFSAVGMMHVGHYEGSLQNGFILKDISIKGLSYLPDALLRIQEIRVYLSLWPLPHHDFDIFNARIFIPDSDPVVFTGKVCAGQIKGNFYSKSVDIHEASRFWASEDIRKNMKGFVSDFDATIQGPLSSPRVTGHFLADNIQYESVLLTEGFSRMDLILIPAKSQVQVKGEVIVESGLVKVRRTNLDLMQSRFNFQNNILNPIIDIHLGAKVEDMEIYLTIKGTLADPQLTVTSDPPMAPQEALQVLFTGNAWEPTTAPFKGVSSGELAQDFLNYSLSKANDQQQFGLKTKLTDNLKLGVAMDQLPSPPGETNIYYSRKIEGEMDMSDHMSLNISKGILPQDRGASQSPQDSQSGAETQVYLQYKKRF
ncbi:MAG: translocation/assembly module TamB domain-containing protein [Candidatus Omnitrophica bacterium]|nr:translocation/assembly module TamB domain-containing protein [Candidatus Omnitrophota bacterium]